MPVILTAKSSARAPFLPFAGGMVISRTGCFSALTFLPPRFLPFVMRTASAAPFGNCGGMLAAARFA